MVISCHRDNMDVSKTPAFASSMMKTPLAPRKPRAVPKVDISLLLERLSLADEKPVFPMKRVLDFDDEEAMDTAPTPPSKKVKN